jgi:murein DD-endopeptidase MepM/ murein hydrolase activator NlpD
LTENEKNSAPPLAAFFCRGTLLFKNYNIVIFKDREGGYRNLRLRGWIGLVLFFLVVALAGTSAYFWRFYDRARALEYELEETQKLLRAHDNQMLALTGKLQSLEEDVMRVQQFDAKLRVLMNIDKDTADIAADENEDPRQSGAGALNNPLFYSRHRELFVRRAHNLVDELASSIRLEEVDQQSLVSFLRNNKDSLLSTPSIWPVKGYLTSSFGWRRSPTFGASRMHQGLDISNRIGTPVRAPARGSVTFSGFDGAYGICITIDHGNGIVTRYAHLSKSSVKVGDYVQRGDVIGAVGNTGRSTGPHLHYEVRVNGAPVNPMRYILN